MTPSVIFGLWWAFLMGLVVGVAAMMVRMARTQPTRSHEGVGHGPVCTRKERAATQAGPEGGV